MHLGLLVITRNFPPQRGGLEAYSYHLTRELARHMPVRVVALRKSKPHLVWFLPLAFVSSLHFVRAGGIRRVHICDAALAPIGLMIKVLSGAKVTASAHGLDVTFSNPVYQGLISACLARLDAVVCVSRATRDECLKRGVARQRCHVIPNGVDPGQVSSLAHHDEMIRSLGGTLGYDLRGKKVLLTVGRLVKRKGVAWFVENVVPRLGEGYVYVVVGAGPERDAIANAVRRNHLTGRVVLAGPQPDSIRNLLFHSAHAFIMPNILVVGDIEGFGIAALEAGACGLPVIASRLQGIPDAVVDGVTGHLVEAQDADAFIARLASLDLDRKRIRAEVVDRFSWGRIGAAYAALLR